MSASYRMNPTNPNGVNFTLSMTMTLKEWMDLRDQLSKKYPSWDLSSKINEMVYFADKHWNERDLEK